MSDNITANCFIDAATYLDFNRFHRFYSNKSSINIIIFPLLIIGFAIANWVIGNNIVGWILFIVGILAPIWILIKFRLDTGLKIKEFDLKNNARVFYSITFDTKGVHVKNKKETADYKWEQVHMVYHTKKYIYVYLTRLNAFIIPSSSIVQADSNELSELLTSHISREKFRNVKPIYERTTK